MSLADGMMAQGAALLSSVFGESAALVYQPPDGEPEFTCDAIIGRERGAVRNNFQTGDVEKVVRKTVKIETAVMAANGVTGLQRSAAVVLNGRKWQVEITESAWGTAIVKLGLVLTEIARNEGMQSRGSV